MGEEEAAFLEFLFELVIAIDLAGVGDTEIEGFLQQVGLDLFQQFLYFFYDSIERNGLFGLGIAACDLDGTVLEVTATHGEANGHTLSS